MFFQVIQGKVADPERFSASLDSWVEQFGPSADGWLGTTSGTYGDNSRIALARFESAEAAKLNSDRPKRHSGGRSSPLPSTAIRAPTTLTTSYSWGPVDPTRRDSSRSCADGWPSRTRTGDGSNFSQMPSDFRPDILGGLEALKDDGTFVMAMYFSSEAEAREGKKKPMPAPAGIPNITLHRLWQDHPPS